MGVVSAVENLRYWSSPSCFWHRVSSICQDRRLHAPVSTTLLLRSVGATDGWGMVGTVVEGEKPKNGARMWLFQNQLMLNF